MLISAPSEEKRMHMETDEDENQSSGELLIVDLRTQTSKSIRDDVDGVSISADLKTMILLRRDGDEGRLFAYPAGFGSKDLDDGDDDDIDDESAFEDGHFLGEVELDDRMNIFIDPRVEQKQMFQEIVRCTMLYHYKEIGDHFWKCYNTYCEKMLPRVKTREDFADAVQEFLANALRCSHAYIQMPGEMESERGFLAADLKWREDVSGYEITKIYRGSTAAYLGPLTVLGVQLEEGSIITAVNFRGLSPTNFSIAYALRGCADREVTLTVLTIEKENLNER